MTKATVTLVFDNTNPAQFPIGYEKCREIMVSRQVVVGGKNKYMINGKAVINKKVSDLFCSVQLNINNPNFLIMQGRITKVLNMKPAEVHSDTILSSSATQNSRIFFPDLVDGRGSSRNRNVRIEER